nr:MAG TPA: hypothetical protein [Caudoviricetes sp.]
MLKHRKNRKGTPGFVRNAVQKKYSTAGGWEKSGLPIITGIRF